MDWSNYFFTNFMDSVKWLPMSITSVSRELNKFLTYKQINELKRKIRNKRKWIDKYLENKYVLRNLQAIYSTYKEIK